MKKEVVETTLVAPSEETRRQDLWLSNLDLQFPHVYSKVISYYPAASPEQQRGGACEGFFDLVERLKRALARALVPFYPLAGRLYFGEDGRRYIDCNGEGVQFVVVRADVTGVEFFEDYQTSPEVTEMFVPALPPEELPCILGLFQVALLKCGGMVVTSCFHHAMVDGTGMFHFMQTWSRLARGLDAAEAVGPEAPFHDRTSLRARSPPAPPDVRDMMVCPWLVARTYPFPAKLIDQLKSRCGGVAASVSTFSAVTAHIWRCMCLAQRLATDSNTRLGMTVNVRQRLRPPLPRSFFGNALAPALTMPRPVKDVIEGSLGSVVEMVRDAVNSVDDAYVGACLMGVDEDEARKKPPEVKFDVGAAAPAPTKSTSMGTLVYVVSWLGMPLYDADFGWGTPKLVMLVVGAFSGMVFLLPRGNDKESGINVLVFLEPEYLPAFEKLLYDDVV